MTAPEPVAPPAQDGLREWRVGQHYGIHVYEGNRPVATFHDEADARRCVESVNLAGPLAGLVAQRDQAEAKVARVEALVTTARAGGPRVTTDRLHAALKAADRAALGGDV